MSRTNDWTVDILTSGNVWTADGNIYRPNEDVDVGLSSTETITRLADGTKSSTLPEIKYNTDDVQFTWLDLDTTISAEDTFITKIKNYVINGDYLRITSHDSETYIGRFTGAKRVWLSGLGADHYDLQGTLTRFSGSA